MPDEICPNGSARNTDVPDFIIIDNEHMTSLLPTDWQWLGQFLPFIPPIALDTNAFCSIDPPEYPDVGAIQWAALAANTYGGGAQEAGRLVAQIVTNLLWYRICHCLVDATPPIPAAPSPPVDLPVVNPPDVVPLPDPFPLAGPCLNSLDGPAGMGAGVSDTDTILTTATGNFGNFHWGPYVGNDNFPIYNVATLRFTTRRTAVGAGPHSTITWAVRWQTRTAFLYQPLFTHAGDGVDHVWDMIPPLGATNIEFQYAAGLASTDTIRFHIDAYCNVPPGTVPAAPECCPPDPRIMQRLDQVLATVTLLQRQGEPFGYVPGPTIHTGLSGIGSIAVELLIGVLVEVATLPPELGHIVGEPTMLFDAGWLSVGTADGYERMFRLQSAHQLVMPRHMGLITKIGYSLAPNVVISIHELVREP